MKFEIVRIILFSFIIITVLSGVSTLQGNDCPRGSLDSRFCDVDGDLLADPPRADQPSKDPAALVFAYTPVEDPAVYRQVWDGFLKHLERATGKKVVFFPVQSNAAEIEAMRAGRLHVAGFNTGSVPLAVNMAGFHPVAMMAFPDGRFGYEMEIVVRKDSPIRTIEQLRGKTLAFTSPTSNSGYKAPRLLLQETYQLWEGRDYKSTFSGKHDNSILGVVNGDYPAAAIANSVLRQMQSRGVVDPHQLRVLYRSATFPTTAYGVAHDLKPELARKIGDAFFSFPWAGSALLKEYGGTEGNRFIPADYKKHWAEVRRIDQAIGGSSPATGGK